MARSGTPIMVVWICFPAQRLSCAGSCSGSSRTAWLAKHDEELDLKAFEGFDFGLTTFSDSRYTPAELEQFHVVRDGAFFTDHACSKFDTRKTALCEPGTRLHRYTTCCRYDDVRSQHQGLFSFCASQVHGLVPANAWQGLVWEAFECLPDLTTALSSCQ